MTNLSWRDQTNGDRKGFGQKCDSSKGRYVPVCDVRFCVFHAHTIFCGFDAPLTLLRNIQWGFDIRQKEARSSA